MTARLADAREALATAIAQINESCPDVKADYTGAEFTAELDEIAAEIASLYEEGKCADEENSVSESIDAVSNALLAYVEAAKAAQAKFELEARNQKAYDAVINQIDGLQKKLDETAERVKELYPTAPVQSYIYVAQSAIDAARQGAGNALVSANDNGEEFAYSFAADTIEELIAEIEKAAKTLGITEIFGDDVDADAICDVFTTDGRVVAKGVRAAEIRNSLTNGFYIIATGNKTCKITVK